MPRGLDFPLLINPDKIPQLTVEQFEKLSYMGLASLFCSYDIITIKKIDENKYECYMRESTADRFVGKPRFKDIDFWHYESAEMVRADIPLDTPLSRNLEKYFAHTILKNTEVTE